MIIHVYYFPKKARRNEEAVSVARSVMFMQDELFPGWGRAAPATCVYFQQLLVGCHSYFNVSLL